MKQEFRIDDIVGVVNLDNTNEYETLDGSGRIVNVWFDDTSNQYMYELEFVSEYIKDPNITIYTADRLRMMPAIWNHDGKWYMFKSNTDCLEAMDRFDEGEELTGWIKTGNISSNMDEYAKDIYVAGLNRHRKEDYR